MKRLTKDTDNLSHICNLLNEQTLFDGDRIKAIHEKLSEYEDIGLTPEEIRKVIYGGVPEWIPKYIEYRELDNKGKLIKLPCKMKELINLLTSLKYTDMLYIYDNKELAWQGYIYEKQVYKYLEDKEVVKLYLGDDGLITKTGQI